jgi:probable O-glycosylation ligase (exosortase A-associated)
MPIRDLIIVAIVFSAAIMALRRPWIGVMLWTWISVMSPHRLTWGFAYSMPVAMIAALAVLTGLIFTRDRDSPLKGAPVTWLIAFAVLMTTSWMFGMDPSGDFAQWDKVMKIYLMTLVALVLLRNKYHIMAFAWVTAGSLGLLAIKTGVFTVLGGGKSRVWGPEGSFINDNNEFGLAMIMTIPLLHFLQLQVRSRLVKHALSFTMLMCFAAALGTHSRGAILAAGAMAVMFWVRSRNKGAIGLLILLGLVAILPVMPQEWWDRMATIREYQDDGSAMGRINAWGVALEVAKHNLFGGGMSYQYQLFFSLYGVYENIVRAAHSIYFQILGNHGFIGLFLYLGIWFSTYRTAGWLRQNARSEPQAAWAAELGAMVQVSLIGFAVGGAFLSLAYYDLPYNMMVMVVLARVWVMTRGWERDPQVGFLEYCGLRRAASADRNGQTSAPQQPGKV